VLHPGPLPQELQWTRLSARAATLTPAFEKSLAIINLPMSGRSYVFAGLLNEGYWGIAVRPNTRYTGSFYAKTDYTSGLPVRIALVADQSGQVPMKTERFLSPFIDTDHSKVCIFNLQSISRARHADTPSARSSSDCSLRSEVI
jgi:hypothetical protein